MTTKLSLLRPPILHEEFQFSFKISVLSDAKLILNLYVYMMISTRGVYVDSSKWWKYPWKHQFPWL